MFIVFAYQCEFHVLRHKTLSKLLFLHTSQLIKELDSYLKLITINTVRHCPVLQFQSTQNLTNSVDMIGCVLNPLTHQCRTPSPSYRVGGWGTSGGG